MSLTRPCAISLLPLIISLCCSEVLPAHDAKLLRVSIGKSPTSPAVLGGSLTLPCLLLPSPMPHSSHHPRVKWSLLALDQETEILVAWGGKVRVSQGYTGRAWLPNYASSPTDFTLQLESLRHSDSGMYRCHVRQGLEDAQDVAPVIVKGEVFHSLTPQRLTLDEAKVYCRSQAAELATAAQLHAAWSDGLDHCSPGWLADGSVRYPVVNPKGNCAGSEPGVKTLYSHSNQTEHHGSHIRHDVYCFRVSRILQHEKSPDNLAAEPDSIDQHIMDPQEGITLGQVPENVAGKSDALEVFPISNENHWREEQKVVEVSYTVSLSQDGTTFPMELQNPITQRALPHEHQFKDAEFAWGPNRDVHHIPNEQSKHLEDVPRARVSSGDSVTPPADNVGSSTHCQLSPKVALEAQQIDREDVNYQTVPPTTLPVDIEAFSIKTTNLLENNHHGLEEDNTHSEQKSELTQASATSSKDHHIFRQPHVDSTQYNDSQSAVDELILEERNISLATTTPSASTLLSHNDKDSSPQPSSSEASTADTLSGLKMTTNPFPAQPEFPWEIKTHTWVDSDLVESTSVVNSALADNVTSLAADSSDINSTMRPDSPVVHMEEKDLGESVLLTDLWTTSASALVSTPRIPKEVSTAASGTDSTPELSAAVWPDHPISNASQKTMVTSAKPPMEVPTAPADFRESSGMDALEEHSGFGWPVSSAAVDHEEQKTSMKTLVEGYSVSADVRTSSLGVPQGFPLLPETPDHVGLITTPVSFTFPTTTSPYRAIEREASSTIASQTHIPEASVASPVEHFADGQVEQEDLGETQEIKYSEMPPLEVMLDEENTTRAVIELSGEHVIITHLGEMSTLEPVGSTEDLNITESLEVSYTSTPSSTAIGSTGKATQEEMTRETGLQDVTLLPMQPSSPRWETQPSRSLSQESHTDVEYSGELPNKTWDQISQFESTSVPSPTTDVETSDALLETTISNEGFEDDSPSTSSPSLVDTQPTQPGLVPTQQPMIPDVPNNGTEEGFMGNISDACMENPCANGGTCVEEDSSVKCLCLPTYGGDRCQTDSEQCEPGWVKFQGFCYRHFIIRQDWEGAEKSCRKCGGHLVSIITPEEQEFITSNYKEYQWTGLNDKTIEGDFRWSDGNPLMYENWYNGQPDSYFSSVENCVVMVWHDHGRWSDVPCNYHLSYTCKKATSSCGQPPALRHARVFGTIRPRYETHWGVRYYCVQGFLQRQNPVIRCLPTGRWEEPKITCIPVQARPVLQHENVEIGGVTATEFWGIKWTF